MVRAALVLVSLMFFCVAARAGGVADADAGLARLNAGDPAAAVALFTRAIQSGELSGEMLALTYYRRGVAFHKQSQAGRAILDYSTALWKEDLPRDFRSRTLNNRGYAFEAINDFESAMRDYNLAIKLNPTYAEAFANRGNVQKHYGHYDQALADYNSALRNGHPRPAFVFAWQGQALENAGKRREAMDAYRQALATDPNCELAKAALSRLEDTQLMGNVLKSKKVSKGPIKPYVMTARPGSQPVAGDEAQLTTWTPPAVEQPAMKDPVVIPAVAPLRRTAFDEQPQVPAAPVAAPPKSSQPQQPPKAGTVAGTPKPAATIALTDRVGEPQKATRVPMGEGGSDIIFSIQLGSFKTPELAETGWLKALKVAGDLLNGLSHVVAPVVVDDGTVYRLYGEALPDRNAALNLCRTLRDKGAPCIVVRRQP